MNPLHAKHCADHAWAGTAPIVEVAPLAEATYRLRIAAPVVARRIVPGQFIMVRLAGCDDPLLGRALALYDVYRDAAGQPVGIDLVFLVVGRMTSRLAKLKPGDEVSLWGPLGNGFPVRPTEHLIIAAGGIGQTPFLALAKEYLQRDRYGDPPRTAPRAERVTFCYGARRRSLLAGVADFEALGVEVRVSTDDGSAGHHGFVTETLAQTLDETRLTPRVVCCGPEKMMEAVAKLCAGRGAACEVSLETPMACGLGICFSCVAQVKDDDGGWDYKRTCVEGPIFDAERLVF